MASSQQQERIKIVFVGDSEVGKSQLLNKLAHGAFSSQLNPTIGIDFGSIELGNNRLQIWDIGGQERFRPITTPYYLGAHYIFLIFDLSKRESFKNLNEHLRQIKAKVNEKTKIVLIGNKSDMTGKLQVTKDEAEAFCGTKGLMGYFETSAKNDTVDLSSANGFSIGIGSAFQMVVHDLDSRPKKQAETSMQLADVTEVDSSRLSKAVNNLSKYSPGVNFDFLYAYLHYAETNSDLFENEIERRKIDAQIKNLPNSKTETAKNIAANIALAILILLTFIVSVPYLLMCDNIYTKNEREHGDRFLFFTDAPKQAAEVALNLAVREFDETASI